MALQVRELRVRASTVIDGAYKQIQLATIYRDKTLAAFSPVRERVGIWDFYDALRTVSSGDEWHDR